MIGSTSELPRDADNRPIAWPKLDLADASQREQVSTPRGTSCGDDRECR